MFETEDNDAVDLWLKRHGKSGFVHELERFHPRLIAFVLAVFLFAGLSYRYAATRLKIYSFAPHSFKLAMMP